MRFKIDEHLPVEIKQLLTHHRHDAVTVPDEGMAGAVDPDVAQACQNEARALVTLDLDFSDIRAYPPEDYQGILVFRPVLHSITTLVRLTTRIIPLLNQEPLIGHLWIVEDHQVRIREEPRRDSCEMTSGNEKAPSPATHGTGQSKQC